MAGASINITFGANLGNLQAVLGQANQLFTQTTQQVNTLNTALNNLATGLNAAGSNTSNAARTAAATVQNLATSTTTATTANRAAATSGGLLGNVLNKLGLGYGQVHSAAQKATSGTNNISSAVGNANSNFQRHTNILNTSANAYKGLIGQVTNMNRFLNIMGSAIRQVGQGLQNFGVVFSIFISTPIATAISLITRELLDYDHQMIEVRKTTGLTTEETAKLGKAIRQLSTMTGTAPIDLAGIAADWGRAGVAEETAILELTRLTDQLVIATDMAADEVVDSVGRIGNIYYKTWQDLAQNLPNLGSMINELGQANPIGESELVSAAMRFAPTAKTSNINIQDLFGLTASVVGTNVSPERAGTQLASAFNMMFKNVNKFAEAMNLSEESTRKLIDADPVGFFLDTAASLQNIESVSRRASLANELWGAVGAKAALSIASNMDYARRNIDLARKSFEEGTSLEFEFVRGMDSVKNQLGLLRNNFLYLGSVIGEVVLPYITKFVALLVPALRLATQAFEGLNERTKLWTVGIALLLAVIGPMIIMLGTFMFTTGIMMTGINTAIGGILNLALGFTHLAAMVLVVFKPITLVGLAIVGLMAIIINLGSSIQGLNSRFIALATDAYNWGNNLMGSFAEGILDAASAVWKAVMSVINNFIGLLQAFSPPKEGPLRGIRDWGRNLVDSYVEGIVEGASYAKESAQKAAMGIADSIRGPLSGLGLDSLDSFSSIFNSMQTIAESVGSFMNANQDTEVFDIFAWSGKAADTLVSYLDAIEKGGTASLSGLSDILGSFTGDFEKLVGLQQDYNESVEKLAKIREELENVDTVTNDQIIAIAKRTDLTLSQRSALIRRTRLDAVERKAQLKEEEKSAQEEEKTAKDSVTKQERLISILSGLLDTFQEAKKTKVNEYAGLLDNFDDTTDIEDNSNKMLDTMQKMEESSKTFFDKLNRGKEIIDGFMAGLRGDEINPIVWKEMTDGFKEGFERGSAIRFDVLKFLETVAGYKEKLAAIGTSFWAGFDIFYKAAQSGFTNVGLKQENLDSLNRWGQILAIVGWYAGYAAGQVDKFASSLIAFFASINTETGLTVSQEVANNFIAMWEIFKKNIDPDGSIATKIEGLMGPLTSFVNLLMLLAGIAWTNAASLGEALAMISGFIVGLAIDEALDVIYILGALADLIVALTTAGDLSGVIEQFNSLSPVLGAIASSFYTLQDVFTLAVPELITSVTEFYNNILLLAADIVGVFIWLNTQIEQVFGVDLGQILNETIGIFSSRVFTFLGILVDAITGIFKMLNLVVLATRAMYDPKAAVQLAVAGADYARFTQESLARAQAGWSNEEYVPQDERGQKETVMIPEESPGAKAAREFAEKAANVPIATAPENTGWQFDPAMLNPMNWFKSQEATDEAAASGAGLATDVNKAFSDAMASESASVTMGFGVTSALDNTAKNTDADIKEFGTTIGSTASSGFGAHWASDEAQIQLNSILTATELWATENTKPITDVGVSVGTNLSEGISDSIANKNAGAIAILDSFDSLIESNNAGRIKWTGFEIGTLLLEGIGAAIIAGENYIWGKITQSLTGGRQVSNVPIPTNEFVGYLTRVRSSEVNAEGVNASALSLSGENKSGQPEININITVDAATASDYRNASIIASVVRSEIEKQLTYSRVR